MADYLSIEEAVAKASNATGCQYTQVPGKKIMFQGRTRAGESILLCTPQAKRQPQGFFWVDITSVQRDLMNSYDKAVVVFRLEGGTLVVWNWNGLRSRLTPDCMKYNKNEGNHWKLYIYDDHIKIVGNSEVVTYGK